MKLDYAKALTSINEFGKIDLTFKRIKFEKTDFDRPCYKPKENKRLYYIF